MYHLVCCMPDGKYVKTKGKIQAIASNIDIRNLVKTLIRRVAQKGTLKEFMGDGMLKVIDSDFKLYGVVKACDEGVTLGILDENVFLLFDDDGNIIHEESLID